LIDPFKVQLTPHVCHLREEISHGSEKEGQMPAGSAECMQEIKQILAQPGTSRYFRLSAKIRY